MRNRKVTKDNPETLDADRGQEGGGFFACYLLTSLSPRFKGHTYIGFTVNPKRRVRQHNGEIKSGAWRTKSKRPWEMVLCIYGFPTNVSALQFEWAWQHPVESLAVRQFAAAFKSFSGVANKIKLAYTMLNLPAWKSLNITVNYSSTKHICHGAVCPSLPDHMTIQVRSIDELPGYLKKDASISDSDNGMAFVDEENSVDTGLGEAGYFPHAEEARVKMGWHTCSESSGEQHESFEKNLTQESVPAVGKELGFLDSTQMDDEEVAQFVDTKSESELASSNAGIDGLLGLKEKQSTVIDLMDGELNQSFFGHGTVEEVEVIDLLTPPRHTLGSCSEKAMLSSQCTVVIDLTMSPSFVQL